MASAVEAAEAEPREEQQKSTAAAVPETSKERSKVGASSLMMRQMQAIKRVASVSTAAATATASGSSTTAPDTAAVEKADAPASSAANKPSGPRHAQSSRALSRPKTPRQATARLLGLPVRGTGNVVKEKAATSKTASPAAGALWKRSMRISGLATKTRIAPAAPNPSVASRPLLQRVPPVIRVDRQVLPQAKASRNGKLRIVPQRAPRPRAPGRPSVLGRALAAAGAGSGKVATTLSRAGPPVKASPGVGRLLGMAGLVPVKKEASDDEGQPRRKTVIVKVADAERRQRTQIIPAKSATSGGFGYGEGSEVSDEDAAEKPTTPSAKRQREPADERRSSGMAGVIGRHLGTARQEVARVKSVQRSLIRVKEEARSKPDPSPQASEDVPARKRRRQGGSDENETEKTRQEEEEAEDKALEAKEMINLQRRLEDHYMAMKNYIRTKAEPTIFFLPARHSSASKKELEETRAAISAKIKSLKAHLKHSGSDGGDSDA